MKNFASLTKSRRAAAAVGGLKKLVRTANEKVRRQSGGPNNKTKNDQDIPMQVLRNRRDYNAAMVAAANEEEEEEDDEEEEWLSVNGDSAAASTDNYSASDDGIAPATDPRQVIPSLSERRRAQDQADRAHAGAMHFRDLAYRLDVSPNVPAIWQIGRTEGTAVPRRRDGPGPAYDYEALKADNLRRLRWDRPYRQRRNARRAQYNRLASPLSRRQGAGYDVLGGGEEAEDNMATAEDITARSPPKCDLGPAAKRTTTTPRSQEDPFEKDATWPWQS